MKSSSITCNEKHKVKKKNNERKMTAKPDTKIWVYTPKKKRQLKNKNHSYTKETLLKKINQVSL